MRFQRAGVTGMAFALWPMLAFTQPATTSDPVDPTTSVPATRYDSVFRDYSVYRNQEPGAWREHNDEMARVAGHAGHVKASVPESERSPADHDQHHGK